MGSTSDQIRLSFTRPIDTVRRVIVVGAGIGGLAAAYYLHKMGFDVRIYERAPRAGGAISSSLREDTYLVEDGPALYWSGSEAIAGLTRELSLDRLHVEGAFSHKLVYGNGLTAPFPTSLMALVRSPLLTAAGKARLFAEPFVRSRSSEGETLADFVRRRMGREVLDTLVTPLVSCLWAGDPEELEAASCMPELLAYEKECGSVIRGLFRARRSLIGQRPMSYRWGMETLPVRLAESLKKRIRLNAAVDEIVMDERSRLFVVPGDSHRPRETDAVVIASDARSAAALLEKLSPRAAMSLDAIPHASLAFVHMAFNEADLAVDPRAAGIMLARSDRTHILSATFLSPLFMGRAPEREVLLSCTVGGSLSEKLLDLDDGELIAEVRRDLHAVLGIFAKPKFTRIKRRLNAIPRYTVGHARRLFDINEAVDALPGVFLTGNYFSGISVSDVIERARATAESVKTWFSRPRIRKCRN